MRDKIFTGKLIMTFLSSFAVILLMNFFLNYQQMSPMFMLMSGDVSGALAQSLDLAYFGKITAIVFGETTALSGVFYMLSKRVF